MNLFDYTGYKSYLFDLIEANKMTRGFKSKIASFAGCQKTYISQVLNTHVHLTPEHGMALALAWNFDQTETEYWLNLINFERTSFPPLKKKIFEQLQSIKEDSADLSKRFKENLIQNSEQQLQYYSSYLYGGIHMLVGVDRFRTPKEISQKLKAPVDLVIEILSELLQMGLVKMENNEWQPTAHNIHLGKDSPMNLLNHQIWRSQAITDIQNKNSSSLHYSAVQTLDEKSFQEIKRLILETIEKQRKIVGAASENEVDCFVCDWFKL